MEQLRSDLTTSVRELEEELASVPANRRVEALNAAKNIVDTAKRKVGSFRVGAGRGVDATDPELTRKVGFVSTTVRFKSFLEPGAGGRSRGRVSLEELKRKAGEEDPVGVASFVHMRGGIQAKNRESMSARVTREAKESNPAGVGGGEGGDGNVAAASRVRASGTCTRCKEKGGTGEGHTQASPLCPYAPAKPVKRKATQGASAKSVKGKTRLTSQDTHFVEGNVFDINGN